MQETQPTACFLIIGNEILSGRTKDANLNIITQGCENSGIALKEVRIIPDVAETIIATFQTCCKQFDYVFSSGGIGPTHDDITSECAAKAMGVPYSLHPEAQEILQHYYGDAITDARLKMAHMPENAELIPNPVSGAPGFIINNLHVMAGIPSIFKAMFDHLLPNLAGGAPTLTKTISAYIAESALATPLTHIEQAYDSVSIGSYPQMRQGKLGTSIVLRSTNQTDLDHALIRVRHAMNQLSDNVTDGELGS